MQRSKAWAWRRLQIVKRFVNMQCTKNRFLLKALALSQQLQKSHLHCCSTGDGKEGGSPFTCNRNSRSIHAPWPRFEQRRSTKNSLAFLQDNLDCPTVMTQFHPNRTGRRGASFSIEKKRAQFSLANISLYLFQERNSLRQTYTSVLPSTKELANLPVSRKTFFLLKTITAIRIAGPTPSPYILTTPISI